jgi:hypothetical protein
MYILSITCYLLGIFYLPDNNGENNYVWIKNIDCVLDIETIYANIYFFSIPAVAIIAALSNFFMNTKNEWSTFCFFYFLFSVFYTVSIFHGIIIPPILLLSSSISGIIGWAIDKNMVKT